MAWRLRLLDDGTKLRLLEPLAAGGEGGKGHTTTGVTDSRHSLVLRSLRHPGWLNMHFVWLKSFDYLDKIK